MSPPKPSSWPLALFALGVVYGDIGTSPLYALKECLANGRFQPGVELTVLGPVSLMIWSLTIIVTLKYVLLLTRADNQGEGGIFALYALLRGPRVGLSKSSVRMLTLIALAGVSLLYGDAVITPAISVLAAVQGLEKIHPDLPDGFIPMVAAVILFALFMFQRRGTKRIGVGFGPVMLLWFVALAVLGLVQITAHPTIFRALSPHYGLEFLWQDRTQSLQIMGSVLLAATGCEAMYADIGHFGRPALRRSWLFAAYPALVLNYLGQGAFLLEHPTMENAEHPFYNMVPEGLLIPMVILATMATIIASQAMITGVFSLTQQAVQLGFVPRLRIVHTSTDVRGQIYLPQINMLMMIACLTLVMTFKSSSNLAAAYGLAVSANMLLTTLLLYVVCTRIWSWAAWKAGLTCVLFLSIEVGYVAGGLSKLRDGAWFTLVVAGFAFLIMKTWRDGRAVLQRRIVRGIIPISQLVDELERGTILRVPGIGIFLSSSVDGLPLVLLHHLKHNKMLHQTIVLLSVKFGDEPYVPKERRIETAEIGPSFFRVVLSYGFADVPSVMTDLTDALTLKGVKKQADISFYQSRELLVTDGPSKMTPWRKRLFIFLSRIARPATGYFQLPPRQVIELGIQLDL